MLLTEDQDSILVFLNHHYLRLYKLEELLVLYSVLYSHTILLRPSVIGPCDQAYHVIIKNPCISYPLSHRAPRHSA